MTTRPTTSLTILVLLTALLLLNTGLRMSHIVTFAEYPDEIFMVWHTQGTLAEAIQRAPFDWTPTFSAVTWAWQQVAGDRLETARILPVLLSALTLACLYQVARLFGRSMGLAAPVLLPFALIAVLFYGGTRYNLFIGSDARAYALLLWTGILALWAVLRWLIHPTMRGAWIACITLALPVYVSYTALPFLGLLTLVVLVRSPHLWWRWGVILAGGVILLLPLLNPFLAAGFFARSQAALGSDTTVSAQLLDLYRLFGGSWVWLALLSLAALVSLVTLGRNVWRGVVVLLIWVSVPMILAFISERFLQVRYLWWVMPGAALLVAWASVHVPRGTGVAVGLLALGLAITPYDYWEYRFSPVFVVPFRANLAWLAQRYRADDVLVVDANCTNVDPMGWDYFVPQYFSHGALKMVTDPGDAARVWYVSCGQLNPATEKLVVAHERQAGEFVGPWNFVIRLYERPPELEGVTFGDAIRLNGVQLVEPRFAWREGETITVRTWWSTTRQLAADYSIGLLLLDETGRVVVQVDGALQPPTQAAPLPSSQWQPDVYYEDVRTLNLPFKPNFTGEHQLVLTVYQWWDGTRLSPADNGIWAVLPGDLLHVASISMWSW